ncbi:hypothetical protein [Rhizorhabdus sp.]|uniref:hypothetical protein n=1 Tax=Rhizorhabdus sp. TaxID=1968843 RepID=UPI0035B011EF
MRLYRTTAGLFAGTQAEAGDGASRIMLPDSKAGIIGFLNALVMAPPADQDWTIMVAVGDRPRIASDDKGVWRRVSVGVPEAELSEREQVLSALRGAVGALEFSRDFHRDLSNAEQAFAQDKLDSVIAAIALLERGR